MNCAASPNVGVGASVHGGARRISWRRRDRRSKGRREAGGGASVAIAARKRSLARRAPPASARGRPTAAPPAANSGALRPPQARAAALALKEGEPGRVGGRGLLAEVAHRAWAAAHDQPASAPWARSTVPNVGGVRRLLTDALGGNSARKRARSADGGGDAERSGRGGHQGERRPSRWASSSALEPAAPRPRPRRRAAPLGAEGHARARGEPPRRARVIAARDAAAVVLRCDDGASLTAAEADLRPSIPDVGGSVMLTDGEHEGAVGVLARHDAPARRVTVDLGSDVVVECGASCVCEWSR